MVRFTLAHGRQYILLTHADAVEVIRARFDACRRLAIALRFTCFLTCERDRRQVWPRPFRRCPSFGVFVDALTPLDLIVSGSAVKSPPSRLTASHSQTDDRCFTSVVLSGMWQSNPPWPGLVTTCTGAGLTPMWLTIDVTSFGSADLQAIGVARPRFKATVNMIHGACTQR